MLTPTLHLVLQLPPLDDSEAARLHRASFTPKGEVTPPPAIRRQLADALGIIANRVREGGPIHDIPGIGFVVQGYTLVDNDAATE